ncbi:putative kinase [Microdochium nivale]|nr:putative kinase [Microdochium nivale]
MEAIYTELTERAIKLLEKNASGRHDKSVSQQLQKRSSLIIIAGPPGSGKSTIADLVAARLNKLIPPVNSIRSTQTNRQSITLVPTAVVVRMDGYHYTRAHLSTFPNADEAHARRGAAWTFDAEGVLRLVRRLSQLRDTNVDSNFADISIPTFDHATKDPIADGEVVLAGTPIIILEGNWLLYDAEPWRQLSTLVDEAWFVDVDANTARRRIAQRHLQSGIETSIEAALVRTDSNDLPNGDEVRRKLIAPAVTVWSVDEQH